MPKIDHHRSASNRCLWSGVCLLLAFLAQPGFGSGESQSTNYRLQPLTIGNGGEESASASYAMQDTAGQPSTVGTSASFNFILEAGFWAFQGTRLAPVVLTVEPDAMVPTNPHLLWTGTDAPFVVHRSLDCAALGPNPHTTQGGNSWTDASPPAGTLVCYSVVATAPGDGQ